VQARVLSSRLPGKVLLPLHGKPLLLYLIESLRQTSYDAEIVVVTSKQRSDDPLTELCGKARVDVFRGSMDNVASRFRDVVKSRRSDCFVRICGDSPLLDHELVDTALDLYFRHDVDIVTNTLPRTFPKGMSVAVVRARTFVDAVPCFREPRHVEHVLSYFYENQAGFRILNFTADSDFSAVNLAVDTNEDAKRVSAVIGRMTRPHWTYRMREIVQLCRCIGGEDREGE